MNKAELIVELAEKAGLKKQKAKKVLEAYMEIVTEKNVPERRNIYRWFWHIIT